MVGRRWVWGVRVGTFRLCSYQLPRLRLDPERDGSGRKRCHLGSCSVMDGLTNIL